MAETVDQLQNKISQLQADLKAEKEKSSVLEKKFNDLGLRGKAKLYYSLNRNMSDISEMLDKIKFADINLNDKDDKTMERLKMLWASAKPLVETLSILETSAKITGDEEKDTAVKNVLEFAEVRK
mgnify:CR=1 FL=1